MTDVSRKKTCFTLLLIEFRLHIWRIIARIVEVEIDSSQPEIDPRLIPAHPELDEAILVQYQALTGHPYPADDDNDDDDNDDGHPLNFRSKTPLPAILHTSRESRGIGLEHYKPFFPGGENSVPCF